MKYLFVIIGILAFGAIIFDLRPEKNIDILQVALLGYGVYAIMYKIEQNETKK